jgi:hypothetical protein
MSEIKVDTVAEKTSANGVTIDGLNIKDSKLVTANSVVETNLTDNIVTLAKMASGTDGNIISYDASGNPVAIATGNDGQVLTSTGAGSPPAFETLASVASLSTASGSAPSYSARSWVNFDGDGTVSVRASGNVSSVSDNGTGDYTVNFSTAMSDTNFSCVSSSGLSASGAQTYLQLDKNNFTEAGAAQVATRGETNNRTDSNLVCVGIFR